MSGLRRWRFVRWGLWMCGVGRGRERGRERGGGWSIRFIGRLRAWSCLEGLVEGCDEVERRRVRFVVRRCILAGWLDRVEGMLGH